MKVFATNYEADCSWLLEHDYTIFTRTPLDERFDQSRVRNVPNLGNADYDKLTYLVENYDSLPDVFLWTKSNLFKYISKEEFDDLKDRKEFTPLLTQNHRVYEPVCRYNKGIYEEINNSWYLNEHPGNVKSWKEWADMFNLPCPEYLPFAPGGNYILTREVVHRYPKEFYDKMRNTMPYTVTPGEAQLAERSYYLLWS